MAPHSTSPHDTSPRPSLAPGARGRRARRALSVVLATSLAVPAAVLTAAPAQAAVTGPTNGSVVSGQVAITEARGATEDCVSPPSSVGSPHRSATSPRSP